MPRWDQALYLQFADERTRPSRELLARVLLESPRHVVDLGCGPGNSTALLRARWPGAHVVGVDSSPEMLARARRDLPGVDFVEADVRDHVPEQPVDVLFANAVLQWVPQHGPLLQRWLTSLAPGGALAVQMPCNFDEPSHRLMRETQGPWSARLAQVSERATVGSAAVYYDLLAPSAAYVDVWQTTYEHVVDDPEAIVEWLEGTGLRPYLQALTPTLRADYLATYTAAIDAAYPRRSDGRRLFSFPRLFMVAVRGA